MFSIDLPKVLSPSGRVWSETICIHSKHCGWLWRCDHKLWAVFTWTAAWIRYARGPSTAGKRCAWLPCLEAFTFLILYDWPKPTTIQPSLCRSIISSIHHCWKSIAFTATIKHYFLKANATVSIHRGKFRNGNRWLEMWFPGLSSRLISLILSFVTSSVIYHLLSAGLTSKANDSLACDESTGHHPCLGVRGGVDNKYVWSSYAQVRAWFSVQCRPSTLTILTDWFQPASFFSGLLSLNQSDHAVMTPLQLHQKCMINVKIPLQPHKKYDTTQYGELDFS